MKTHKFFQSHATHYNTISNGVNPLKLNNKNISPKGEKGHVVFRAQYKINSWKGKCPGHDKHPFLSPLRGWLPFIFLTRGFTPGYMLSALRA